MREIKFRGKAWFGGEWHYGLLAKGTGDYTYVKNGHEGVRVDPDTVGQFTGLYDKDGNEIYEDDIVRYYDDIEDDLRTALVIWNSNVCSFRMLLSSYETVGLTVYIQELAVIGNVQDNNELIYN